MASPSSSAVSALAGGLLVEHSGWHAVFWVNVPIAVLAAALTLAGVPESAGTAGKRIDVPGATLVTAGLVLAVAGFARAVRHPWTDRWTLALLIAAAVPLMAFSAQQLRAASPVGAGNLCHQAVFVNHAHSAVTPPNPETVQVDDAVGQRAPRRGLVEGPV